jgi:hypothetical protein
MEEQNSEYNDMPSQGGGGEGEEGEDNMPEEERFFKTFMSEDVDNKDPSLGRYFSKIYEEEVPFEIRIESDEFNQKSIFESLLCKVLIVENKKNELTQVRIELACDKDIYFFYISEINLELFEEIKNNQKLTCNFNEFPDLLIKFLDLCIKDKKQYLAVFSKKENGQCKMELLENLEHKFGDLISLDFESASDDLIKQQINYRYNAMRAIHELTRQKINVINKVIKKHDPQLIYEVKRDVSQVKPESYLRDNPIIQKS